MCNAAHRLLFEVLARRERLVARRDRRRPPLRPKGADAFVIGAPIPPGQETNTEEGAAAAAGIFL